MTKEEYLNNLETLSKMHSHSIERLAKKYALSNNDISVGDVITDQLGSIRVKEVSTSTSFTRDLPECIYRGEKCTKKGKPTRGDSNRWLWQSNISGVNKQ